MAILIAVICRSGKGPERPETPWGPPFRFPYCTNTVWGKLDVVRSVGASPRGPRSRQNVVNRYRAIALWDPIDKRSLSSGLDKGLPMSPSSRAAAAMRSDFSLYIAAAYVATRHKRAPICSFNSTQGLLDHALSFHALDFKYSFMTTVPLSHNTLNQSKCSALLNSNRSEKA